MPSRRKTAGRQVHAPTVDAGRAAGAPPDRDGELRALRESEERLRRAFDQVTDGIFVADEQARYTDVNPAGCELLGMTREEVLARTFSDVLAPEEHPRLPGAIADLADGKMHRNEWRFRRKDGSTFVGELDARRFPDGRFQGVLRDIADRKRTLEALRARDAQFQLLLGELHSGVALLGGAGRFTLYNRRFLEMFELPHAADVELVNRQEWSAWQVHDEGGRLLAVDDQPVWKALRTREPVRNQLVSVRAPSGEVRWMLISAEPMLAPDGAVAQVICTYHDVTSQKRAEAALRKANEELREADRRKDEFLGMLSHELRNPLAPIRSSTYVLRNAAAGSEQAQRAQRVIERQTEHLTRLVDDLLDVTRIARGKFELRRSTVDLREVVLRASDDFRLPMDDRGVVFRTELPEAPVPAHVDGTRITQVVGNLLGNAAKFTRRGDEVSLSLAVEGGDAIVAVRDTGAGIDPALLPAVFDAFVQGERTLARTEGGLGLGLALVKGIAELHGGSVSVESAGKGKGATFVVRFPLAEDRAPREEAGRGERPATGGRRVLVVDDNVDAAESLAEVVRVLGHVAEVAHDGEAAVERARANPPDVVLCDIGLPGMSGYEVAKAIRAAGLHQVRLVAVSGYAQPEDVRAAAEAGFDAHLAKPADAAQIERLLG